MKKGTFFSQINKNKPKTNDVQGTISEETRRKNRKKRKAKR